MKKIIFGSVILIATTLVACSLITKKDLKQDVESVLIAFQNSLNKPDSTVLKQFKGDQPKYEILGAIEVLRNSDSSILKLKYFTDKSKISWGDENWLTVTVPVQLESKEKGVEESSFSLRLFRKNKRFYLERIEAQELYKRFYSVRSEIINAHQVEQRLANIRVYLERAKEIQKGYDSVIWYSNFEGKTYYYVVNGHYMFDSLQKNAPHKFRMGLVDQEGKVIVPVEFDIIGNPGVSLASGVEVVKDGKVGFYSLNGSKSISTEYDWIVRYEKEEASAIVKKDSLFGWLDKEFKFIPGFPSEEGRKYIKEFQFLTEPNFSLGSSLQTLINILFTKKDDLFQATGIVVPSSYLVDIGLFRPIEMGFLSAADINSHIYIEGDDYTEVKNQKPFSLSETITAVVSYFNTHYIGGRGEFYKRSKIVLTDKNFNLVSSIETGGGDDLAFRKISEDLLEAKFSSDPNFEFGYDPSVVEQNFPYFDYFKFDGKNLIKQKSNRRYSFTEYIKMDSSYLQGEFITYDAKNGKGSSKFANEKTLRYMRDEILASYGFIFGDLESEERFKYRNWYKPLIESYDEVFSKASEIDKHNLNFLVGLIKEGKSI